MNVNSLEWARKALENEGELVRSNLHGCEERTWFGATIDTRTDCRQRLFFAMKGERTDGHRFASEALDRGCAAVVADDKDATVAIEDSGRPLLLVRSTLRALQELSRAYRDTLKIRVVAITGSAGKTTIKEYIRIILKKKYRVHSNPGNFNNHIGVPLTLLDTDHDKEYLVSEIGANHVGEVDFLSRMLRPDIGVVSNIGDAHIGLFGSRDRIAEAKAELFAGIDPQGYAVLPQDDDYIELLSGRAQCRVVTFGYADGSTFRLSAVQGADDHIRFQVNGEAVKITSFASYNVLNACAAFAVGDICGVESDRVREALGEFEPMAGRARVYQARGLTLVDDSYNANPTSMRAAISALVARAAGRRVLVLGDMGELGSFSAEAHRELGAFIAQSGIDVVFWLGEQATHVKEGVKGTKIEFYGFDAPAGLVQAVTAKLQEGDVILVKGSRAAELDRFVRELRRTSLKEADA
ncbi:MAG: UDP-N-acetylmuramoyl-tripeptide--D-alanyl-D-alanine ligase [Candidatus Krumholzibacteria bacterium]